MDTAYLYTGHARWWIVMIMIWRKLEERSRGDSGYGRARWVEYVRELSRGYDDPKAKPDNWACSEYSSELNIPDFTKLRDKYRIPESVRLIHPNKTYRHYSPTEGHVAIMSDALACRMRLPLRLFFRAILRRSSSLPKIGLASLGTKKIPTVVKKKSSNNDQRKTHAELILKSREKIQDDLPTPTDMRQTTLIEGWAAYSNKSSAEEKLNAAKALTAWSLVLIEEAEASISDLELNKRNVATALQNTESIMKDRDHYKEWATWL
ncbi:Uncharacterized protein Fot_10690 [Forsythia ovata]|uniref:Uncharacterized protein n=1 Tax=Forsythia ovata TaxID=205694 RepID=A0ABD1WI80_9LAMI